jgi:negative regulator of sigma E activity
MTEELDSQLSTMFDDELPPVECELLARRLSRDEQLKARWGRYAVIGATIRAEGGARLNGELARRVSASISAEPILLVQPVTGRQRPREFRWWRPAAALAVAASVAAASILLLRYEALPDATRVVAQVGAPVMGPLAPGRSSVTNSNAPYSYVVPRGHERPSIVPATQLANYVVAHSEFSSPVNRRNLLSALMASEPGTAGTSSGSEEPAQDVYDDAKNAQ